MIPYIIGSSPQGRSRPDTIRAKVTDPPEIIDHNDASLSGFLVKRATTTGIIIPETMKEYEYSINSRTLGIFMARNRAVTPTIRVNNCDSLRLSFEAFILQLLLVEFFKF